MEKTRVSTPPPAQTAPAAPTNRSKASASTAAPDDAGGGAGGFLSLLSALGDSMDAPVDAPASALLGSAVDAELLPPESSPTDAAILMAWMSGNMPQAPLSSGIDQTASDAVDVLGAGQDASALSLGPVNLLLNAQELSLASLQAELLPSAGLVAQTARLDGAADVRAPDGQNPLAGSRRAFSRTSSALPSILAGVSTAALAAGQRAVGGGKPLASPAVAAAPVLQTAPERRDAAVVGASMPRTGSEFNAVPAPPVQAAALAPDALAAARSNGDRAAPGGVTEVWGGASAGPEASQSLETGAPVAEPSQTAAEDALAEQVAFWVSENLQNAELTVTHDGKPVEVSVSMSGKEAHIVFGSDQSETRELLDASVAQLRDLLHSEGLTLSGMTVGESGARNPNSNPNANGGSDTPRGRQGGRQAQVMAPGAEVGTARPRILTETAVDLFV